MLKSEYTTLFIWRIFSLELNKRSKYFMTPPSEEFFYRKTFESCHFFPAFCTRFLSLVCILMDRIASTLYVVYRTNNIMLSLFFYFFFFFFFCSACTSCPKKEMAPKSRSRSSSANEASKPIYFGRKWPSSGGNLLCI